MNNQLNNNLNNTDSNILNNDIINNADEANNSALIRIQDIAKETMFEKYVNDHKNESSSFDESFPNYGDAEKGIFSKVKKIHENISSSQSLNNNIVGDKKKDLTQLIDEQINSDNNIINPFLTNQNLKN